MKDHLQERINKLIYKGIFINKLDRDKDSLHENSDLTNAASMEYIAFSTLYTCCITHDTSVIYLHKHKMKNEELPFLNLSHLIQIFSLKLSQVEIVSHNILTIQIISN